MIELTLPLAGYLLGSIPTGYLLGSLAGVDVRKQGSGNVGATNVARVLGVGRGLLTLAIDAGKGWLAVFLARQLDVSLIWVLLAGIAAFLGHLYPVFLRFRGGKGVATALGIFLYLAPLATLVLVGIFALTVIATRIVSLASIVAALAAPLMFWWFDTPPAAIVVAGFIAAMIIWRHRSNIQRLLAGTESRFGGASSR
jgi:glycerol-3-phosphate acyltransferase PlsY